MKILPLKIMTFVTGSDGSGRLGWPQCRLKFIIFNAKFIIFNAKFIVFNARFLVFNAWDGPIAGQMQAINFECLEISDRDGI